MFTWRKDGMAMKRMQKISLVTPNNLNPYKLKTFVASNLYLSEQVQNFKIMAFEM